MPIKVKVSFHHDCISTTNSVFLDLLILASCNNTAHPECWYRNSNSRRLVSELEILHSVSGPAKRCGRSTVGIQMQREFVTKNLNDAFSFVNLSRRKGFFPIFTVFVRLRTRKKNWNDEGSTLGVHEERVKSWQLFETVRIIRNGSGSRWKN